MKVILKKLKSRENIFLFLDYDGTAVPIKKVPQLARLHPNRRRLLEKISKKIPVAVVSGRSLQNIKNILKIKRVHLVGNHGLEISCRGKVWIHPQALSMMSFLKKKLKKIEERVSHLKGVVLEDKGLSGSVHYRLLKPKLHEVLKSIVEEEVVKSGEKLKIRKGKKVIEIRPNIDWDKGKSVKKLTSLMNLKRNFLRIYIGDDETDEDAFRIFGEKDITVLVGRKKNSLAKFRLNNVEEVWAFLKKLSKNLKNQQEGSKSS